MRYITASNEEHTKLAALTGIMADNANKHNNSRRIWFCMERIKCVTCDRTLERGELFSLKQGISVECPKCWPFRIVVLNAESYPGCLHITHAKRSLETASIWKAETNHTENP